MIRGRPFPPLAPMRKTPILFTIVLALAMNSDCLTAQASGHTEAAPFLFPTSIFPVDATSSETSSWKGRIPSALAGAALGAGLGYFASQVARGDWDEGGGQKEIHRSTWAAVGGAGGFALGFSIRIWGQPPGGGSAVRYGGDRLIISSEEIMEASVTNALEAVRLFHPEWLVQRGQEAFAGAESDNIRVYLDQTQLGGIETLQGVNTLIIDSIRFYDAQRATARWGAGHTHGAIQIITSS